MKSKPIATIHSKERLRERSGLNKKSIDRMVEIAYNKGYSHSQTKGRLKKWVDGLFFYDMSATNIKLYGDKAYLFKKNGTLITVLQVPSDLTKDLKKMIKEK